MSFFIKSKKSNGVSRGPDKRRKRAIDQISKKNDEVTSSEDEDFFQSNKTTHESTDDENETAQEKKLRLAKVYLEEIEKQEKERLEYDEVGKEVLSQRLRDDHLKQIGKFETRVADRYTGVDEKNTQMLKCREQRNTITCICVSSDDKWLFSGSKDGVIVKWSIKDKKKLGVIPFVRTNIDRIIGHSSCIHSLALSTDNKFLVVGDSSGTIQVWNPETLQHMNSLNGHKKPVTGLCFKLNSHTLYSSSNDRSVRVWSLTEMAFVETLFGHQDAITAIDVLHSDRPVTAGGRDGTLRLWKVSEESQLIFNAQPSSVDTIKLINDQNFVSGGDDGQLQIWSALKKKALCSIKAAHGCDASNSQPYWITAVATLPHSDLIASGSQDGFVRIWKTQEKHRTISELFAIPVTGFVNSIAFTADGDNLIVGCGKDHRLGRWSTVKSAKNALLVIPLIKT